MLRRTRTAAFLLLSGISIATAAVLASDPVVNCYVCADNGYCRQTRESESGYDHCKDANTPPNGWFPCTAGDGGCLWVNVN